MSHGTRPRHRTRTVPTLDLDGRTLTDGDRVHVRHTPGRRDGGTAIFHGAIVDEAGTVQCVVVWDDAWRYFPSDRIDPRTKALR